jgi:hydroxymethylpyrimidine pyrophosphatase-like HAD family hydrolase
MLIAVDFDGTIVEHKFPAIGKERPFATDTLKQLIADGHRLVLWTNRKGQHLEEAVQWCKERGVEFYSVNKCFPEENINFDEPRKIKVDLYIDDRNIGGLPEWGEIYTIISQHISYRDYLARELTGEKPQHKKRKHWWQR